jgi:hypothetical protein
MFLNDTSPFIRGGVQVKQFVPTLAMLEPVESSPLVAEVQRAQ